MGLAWQEGPLAPGAELRDRIAFAWRAMDALYEEDERIAGHAAVYIDDARLHPEPGQSVVSHGLDRDFSPEAAY